MVAPTGPLDGLPVALTASGGPYRVAAGLLAGLGARIGTAGDVELGGSAGPSARLVPAGHPLPEAGLPPGTLEHATGLALAAAVLAGWRSGRPVEVWEVGVAVEVWLPEVMAASYSAPPALRPAPPVPAPGGGWLNLDLGAPGDRRDYEAMLATLPADADAARVAATAQEWRLAVCDYRRRVPGPARSPIRAGPRPGGPGRGAPELTVCDLTAMWAGPLATRLLQDLGATIHKVEPAFRPDGMRALDGRGIHPGGHQVDPGLDSGMWHALNRRKVHHDLDLRRPDQLQAFLDLASGCDLVIDSFSPRVMPNLGVPDGLPGRPARLSMPAFPPGPRRNWVAYGPGVHAISGLGDRGDGRFDAPAVSYPDALGGFTGALAALAAVSAGRGDPAPVRVEATLADSVTPLLARGEPGPLGPADPDTGPRLLEMAARAGLLITCRVAGVDLLHPAGPFRFS